MRPVTLWRWAQGLLLLASLPGIGFVLIATADPAAGMAHRSEPADHLIASANQLLGLQVAAVLVLALTACATLLCATTAWVRPGKRVVPLALAAVGLVLLVLAVALFQRSFDQAADVPACDYRVMGRCVAAQDFTQALNQAEKP